MSPDQESLLSGDHRELWNDIGGMIAKLPEVEQRQYYKKIATLLHDMRHTMGLVITSEKLIRRDFEKRNELQEMEEILDIISKASWSMVALFDALKDAFEDQVDVGANGNG